MPIQKQASQTEIKNAHTKAWKYIMSWEFLILRSEPYQVFIRIASDNSLVPNRDRPTCYPVLTYFMFSIHVAYRVLLGNPDTGPFDTHNDNRRYHDANFVIAGGIEVCCDDNLQCHLYIDRVGIMKTLNVYASQGCEKLNINSDYK